MPARAAAGRRGGLSGVQPHLMAQRVVTGHEGRSRTRGCADVEEVFDRRVSGAAQRLFARPDCARALSGEDPAAWRTERYALQHVVRGTLQRDAAIAHEAFRLASAGVL